MARKPGNVHRYRDFADAGLADFILSAAAVRPVLEAAAHRGIGETVLAGVKATRQVVTTNTNLGILLLLTPLAAVHLGQDVRRGVEGILAELDVQDSRGVYEAIRLAGPRGLKEVPEQDIRSEPTLPLRQIMALAADRDLIARQYADGFREVFDDGVRGLRHALERGDNLEHAIIFTHLYLLSRFPDSLLARKRGQDEADEASRQARQVIALGWPHSPAAQAAFDSLDAWLRAEGHSRNPGTTADLVTASLFTALRQGIITLPSPWPLAPLPRAGGEA
jgi:triphosphoribosyl-dephospho-CoA synthase